MFSWLKSWFKSPDRQDIYSPKQRAIYTYFDGEKLVKADPLPLYRKVMDKGVALSQDIKLAGSLSKDADKGQESLVKTIREIFAIKPIEEGGLTIIETMNLLDHFLLFCESVKKNSSQSATTLIRSAASKQSSHNGQPTDNSSASGSIGGASTSAGLASSPTA